jgi:hypothetical protein
MTLLAAATEHRVEGETLTLLDGGGESLIYTATSGASPGE